MSSSFTRTDRESSTAPSREFRAFSAAPMRATSRAPFRSSSVAPMRASSVLPMRASSVAPPRASSVAPYRSSRAFSVSPYYGSMGRASSVTPYSTLYDAGSRFYRAPSLTPLTTRDTFRTSSQTPRTSTYRIDTSVPTRQFGTRLGVHKMETSVKPTIYGKVEHCVT